MSVRLLWMAKLAAGIAVLILGLPVTTTAQIPSCVDTTSCFNIDGTVTNAVNSGVTALSPTPPGPQALITDDSIKSQPGSKELGPINGSNTKVGVIHNNIPPNPSILGLTSINAQTDLLNVYTQTAKATDGDIWYYFGWTRASPNGSGFISIEFEAAEAPTACNYALIGTNQQQTLINNCNPWRNRHGGDFLILWDQNGGSTAVYMRIFAETNGVVTLPACPTGWPENTAVADTAFCKRIAANVDVFATYGTGGDTSRGEMALNLTNTVFNPPGSSSGPLCRNFANIIPNTVTGNSDTADYKDTVLNDFPDITNCGSLKVKKATFPEGLSATFKYKVTPTTGNMFDNTPDSDCEDNGTTGQPPVPLRDRCWGRLEGHGVEDVISNVLPGNYDVLEYDVPGTFTPFSIVCTFKGTAYVGIKSPETGEQPLPVPVEAFETTSCVITNNYNKTTPSATSRQRVIVFDELTINDIVTGATNQNSATLRIELYSNSGCTAQSLLATSGPITLTADKYESTGTNKAKIVLKTSDLTLIVTPNTTGEIIGYLANFDITRYWAFRYSGDNLNNAIDSDLNSPPSSCGFETIRAISTDGTFPPPAP